MIRLRLQKLVDEIAVGGVNLHAVEAGSASPGRGAGIVGHHARDLGGIKSPRCLVRLLSLWRVDAIAGDRDGRRRYGQAASLEARMGSPSHVPQLEEDPSATGMDGVRCQPPAFRHGVGIDPGRIEPAVGLLGDSGRLGDDETGRTTLGVVFGHQGVGSPRRAGTRTGERRHHDAVGKREIAELKRLEER